MLLTNTATMIALQGLAASYALTGSPRSDRGEIGLSLFNQSAENALSIFIKAVRNDGDPRNVASCLVHATPEQLHAWQNTIQDAPRELRGDLERSLYEAAHYLVSGVVAANQGWTSDILALGAETLSRTLPRIIPRSQATALFEPSQRSLDGAPKAALSPGGRFYAIGREEEIFIYDARTNQNKASFKIPPGSYPRALSEDGRYFVTSDRNSYLVTVWDIERQSVILEFEGQRSQDITAHFSEYQGDSFVSLSSGNKVFVSRLSDGQAETVFQGHLDRDNGSLACFTFIPQQGLAAVLPLSWGNLHPPSLLRLKGDRFAQDKRDLEDLSLEPFQNVPQLSRRDYAALRLASPPRRGADETSESRSDYLSYDEISWRMSEIAEGTYGGASVTPDGGHILAHRHRGMGDDRGGGNFVSSLDVFSLFSRRHVVTVDLPNEIINSAAISPDKRRIALGSPSEIYVFNKESPDRPLLILEAKQGYLGELEFFGERTILSGGRFGDVLSWELPESP